MIGAWTAPDGHKEYAFVFDRGRSQRVLVLPALFDEANKLRRLTVEVMRRLDGAGIDCFLPDLPGCNESLAQLEEQSVMRWRDDAKAAAAEFGATSLLAVRAGALLAPPDLTGWRYAPVGGPKVMRAMLRARVLASKEAGRAETSDKLMEIGRDEGLELAGYRLGPTMIRDLEAAELPETEKLTDVPQSMIGGAGLWVRAEPDFEAAQADAIAAVVSLGMRA